jgi:3-oxoadipate enol-lactonase
MFANVGGRRIHYETLGNEHGPALVLIRGLARNSLHWGPVLERLANAFYLVLLDNRGVGRSDPSKLPFLVPHLADDVVAVMDAANVARAHVLGTSLGGMIAMRFAIDHGGRLDRLVLVSTTAGGAGAPPPRLRSFLTMARGRLRPLRESLAIDADLVLGRAYASAHPEVIDGWYDIARRHPVAPKALVYQALAARLHDASRELGAIRAPTLVLSCREDHLVPPENSERLARGIAGAEMVYLDGDSHEVLQTHLESAASRIEEFLLRPLRGPSPEVRSSAPPPASALGGAAP